MYFQVFCWFEITFSAVVYLRICCGRPSVEVAKQTETQNITLVQKTIVRNDDESVFTYAIEIASFYERSERFVRKKKKNRDSGRTGWRE